MIQLVFLTMLFAFWGCTTSQNVKGKSVKINDDDHPIRKIEIDSNCINELKSYVLQTYGFESNSFDCQELKKFKRTVHFHYDHTVEDDTPYPIDDRFVLVILGENCEIDSVITSLKKIK